MNATTAPRTATTAELRATAVRGTFKRIAASGVDMTRPVMVLGSQTGGPAAEGIRYDYITCDSSGVKGHSERGEAWLGGVATRFWAAQVTEAASVVEGDELDGLSFAQLMTIAKALKVPGRGTARIDALRAGIRVARAAR